MNASRRLGLLGGMFDPIHCGHLDVGAAAAQALQLTDLLLLPANIPPHRPQPFASSYHRFAMVAMAIAGRAGWRALDLELREPVPSYTAETLRHFHASGFDRSELFFVTGADAFLEIASWHDYPAVLDLANFVVVARPAVPVSGLPARLPALALRMRHHANDRPPTGGPLGDGVLAAPPPTNPRSGTWIFLIDAPTADVSSTAIRRACRDRQSLEGLVPSSVRQHIEQHRLYEDPTATPGSAKGRPGAAAGRLHGQD